MKVRPEKCIVNQAVKRLRQVTPAVLLQLALATPLFAMAGTEHIASKGAPVSAEHAKACGWPDGVMEIVNDPCRGDGWNPWFTELPNDNEYYELHMRTMDEINNLLAKLGRIRGARVLISPESEVRIGWTAMRPRDQDPAIVFVIGSETARSRWRNQLAKSKKDETHKLQLLRVGGPKALPATIIIYAGNPVIDLDKLQIPKGVAVDAEKRPRSAGTAKIEEFVRKHNKPNGEPAAQR